MWKVLINVLYADVSRSAEKKASNSPDPVKQKSSRTDVERSI